MAEVPLAEAPQLTIKLILRGEFDPDSATRLIGLQPSETWRKGEPRTPRTALKWEDDGWAVTRGPYQALELAPQVEELLAVTEARRDRIRSLALEHNLMTVLYAVAYVNDQTPLIELSPNLMLRIADMGARFDIDIILLPAAEG